MLKVKKLSPFHSIGEVETYFESVSDSQAIACVNWSDFQYKPEVSFKIAHTGKEIYLQYIVREKYLKAELLNDNDSVWTDSCVEFFFSPIEDGSYYNIEFNCIGTALIGYGFGKVNRERAGIEVTSKMLRHSSLGTQPIGHKEGDFSWKLTMIIPVSAFYKHDISNLSGMKSKANFYKCGDGVKKPHYVSWQPIEFERPNFHLPQYFDEIIFE